MILHNRAADAKRMGLVRTVLTNVYLALRSVGSMITNNRVANVKRRGGKRRTVSILKTQFSQKSYTLKSNPGHKRLHEEDTGNEMVQSKNGGRRVKQQRVS